MTYCDGNDAILAIGAAAGDRNDPYAQRVAESPGERPAMDSSTASARRHGLRAARVARLTATLLLAAVAAAALPWLLGHNGRHIMQAAPAATLQAHLERDASHGLDDVDAMALIPFTRVTFARGPCYGDCATYRMILHRNGQLELLHDTHVTHRSSVSWQTLARVAQLVERAQATATRRVYLAQRTDALMVSIVVAGPHGAWRVTDFGEVAPIDVWALEQVLHAIYTNASWQLVAAGS